MSGYERPITISPSRKDDPVATRPEAGPLLRIEVMTCGILGKYGLRVEEAETICLPFSGCDIAPCRGM